MYTMSSETIEKITKLDAYTNMDHCVYSVLATSIKDMMSHTAIQHFL